MENYISEQLISFLRAALVGLTGGAVYDLLRAVRLRGRSARLVTHLLDVVYVLSALLVVFLFALRQGQGELRLYMLAAMTLGFCCYFWLFCDIFRPLWRFWVDVLASVLHLLWKPAEILLIGGKNFQIYIKKLFHFWCKCATMGK